MLLCDARGAGWRTYCLQPPLKSVPKGAWVCPDCARGGITAEHIEARPISVAPAPSPTVFPSAVQRRRRDAAAALDGKKVRQDPNTLEPLWQEVALRYLGPSAGPQPLEALYTNGTTERFTPARVKPWLLTDSDVVHAHVQRKIVLVSRARLPDYWDLDTIAGVRGALNALMPDGVFAPEFVTELTTKLHLQRSFCPAVRRPVGQASRQFE
jgi:hypothetical protein